VLKTENGPFLYQFAKAAATMSFSPIADRGALVRRIGITAQSATDTWVVTSNGKETMRIRQHASGNQRILRADDQGSGLHDTFFDFCRWILGMDPSIAVPLGQTLTIASVGGATANIMVEFEEHDNSDLSPALLNHPDGKEWLVPIVTSRAASVAATGVLLEDTQVGPSWLPNFLLGTLVTNAWRVQLLAMFMEGAGVNTFSGAANHQSTTNTKQLTLDSRLLNSRTTSGIPNVGTASAAGSANTVFGQTLALQGAFEKAIYGYENVFNAPIVLNNGDTFTVADEIVGDVTGGADYSAALTVWIARVSELV
jgi:hypothetical protein